MIALIDYGAGNLTSVRKGFAAAGAELYTPRHPAAISPGPTASSCQASAISRPPRRSTANGARPFGEALDRGVQLFGICLGQQWLFEGSDEDAGGRRPRRHRRALPAAAADA